MTDELSEARGEIDRIDREMLRLFTERMNAGKRIGTYKKEHDLPINNPAREKEILLNIKKMAGTEIGEYAESFFSTLFELSKDLQSKIELKKEDVPVPVSNNRKIVCIAGLGLLGTSLAMALNHQKYQVACWCRSKETAQWAIDQKIVETMYETPEEAFRNSDFICLCLPIPIICDFIRKYGHIQKKGALLTDIGSVKGVICKTAESVPNLNFIGSHPMAGTEKSGPHSAFRELYNNADVFITPSLKSDPNDVAFIEDFWESLHTHVRKITPDQHDSLVANTSHMLHIIASSLSQSILDAPDSGAQRLHYTGCATGFRDTSRIASSSPAMWKEICGSNSTAIFKALDEFQLRLNAMRKCLQDNRMNDFEQLFARGRYLRDSWLCYKASDPLPVSISLCGIKHSGKTSAAREIAHLMQMESVDSDDAVCRIYRKETGKVSSVREIYKELGEDKFRELEAKAIRSLTSDGVTRVISLGGGALSNPYLTDNDKHSLGFICCLDVPDEIAYQRILKHGLPPFLQNEADPFAAFRKQNEIRRTIFRKEAKATVIPNSFETTPKDVALHILSEYKEHVL